MPEQDVHFEQLDKLLGQLTNHGSGLKKVFLANEDSSINLTQFAYGEFM